MPLRTIVWSSASKMVVVFINVELQGFGFFVRFCSRCFARDFHGNLRALADVRFDGKNTMHHLGSFTHSDEPQAFVRTTFPCGTLTKSFAIVLNGHGDVSFCCQ